MCSLETTIPCIHVLHINGNQTKKNNIRICHLLEKLEHGDSFIISNCWHQLSHRNLILYKSESVYWSSIHFTL